MIQTTGAYQSSTDTVTFTVGSTDVVGLLTAWTGAIVGLRIYMPGDSVVYTVAAAGSTTDLTLDRPYEGRGLDGPGVVYAASAYVLMQNIYPLPSDCRSVNLILDAVTSYPLTPFTQAELENTAGIRTLVDLPKSYAEIEDTPEPANGVTIHQVELFPPPRLARGYTVEYLRKRVPVQRAEPSHNRRSPFVCSQSLSSWTECARISRSGKAKCPRRRPSSSNFKRN